MLFDDTYRTPDQPAEGLFRDRGSKFLAFVYPIRTETDAKTQLEALRKAHPKANHHCYAYRLGLGRDTYRVSDDGEPNGTAGRPILNTIYGLDQPGQPLTNLLVVVVRYFGGTLLGVPGLINAYKSATTDALANTKLVSRTVNEVYRLAFGFEQMNNVMKLVKEQQLTVLGQAFDTVCTLEVEMRKTQVNAMLKRIDTLTEVTATWVY
jgi:uncharacterized YigZ family protein